MKLHADSHIDHGLTGSQVAHLLVRFADRDAFFIETIELPPELGTAPCDLFGPLVGDEPVPESEVTYLARGDRKWTSRCIAVAHPRTSRKVTVIAGPHDGHPCVLYTAYGGPLAPQEVGDLEAQLTNMKIATTAEESEDLKEQRAGLTAKIEQSRGFWSQHALITLPMNKLG